MEHKYKVGQKVKLYRLINPQRDLKGTYKIVYIKPSTEGRDALVWFQGLASGWSIEALGDIVEEGVK